MIKVGTRSSNLAIQQVNELKLYFPDVKFSVVYIDTMGDKDKTTPLVNFEGTDFFTRELEDALINKTIDIAVHSAKDVESAPPRELVAACITNTISPFEALVSKSNLKLSELPKNAIIGTSSKNRKNSIKRFRNDLIIKDIRGNVDERIAQLDKGDFDAIVVAHAALIRLKLDHRIAQIILPDIIKPHPLQGRLLVQTRKNRQDLIKLFRRIDAKAKIKSIYSWRRPR